MARNFTLDKAHLVAMLGDPTFFTDCPVFLWLRKSALVAYTSYKGQESACAGCNPPEDYMNQVFAGFFENLFELHQLDPAHIECVRAYLSRKKGYQVGKISFYRKRNGKPERFEF